MNPSNPAKFGVAFAAGLVVALAGVMIYVRTSGLHVQEAAAVTPAVQQHKQPESLNAGKPEEPPAVPMVKPLNPPPVAETPVPAVPVPAPVVRQKALPPLVRHHYPPHSLPESQSTIRVEVSQIKPASEPMQAQAQRAQAQQAQPPVPVAAVPPPVRAVNEEQQPLPARPYNAPTPPPEPHTVTLQPGTNLVVRMGETLSTDHNYSGDTFRATLDRPVVLDGFVIADKGSKVLGKIVGVDKAGKFEGTSNLQLALTEINTTDGQRVHVQTGFFNKKGGAANSGQEAAKVGGGAVLGAIIGAVAGGGKGAAIGAGAGGAVGAGTVMMGKGRPAVIPTETQLTFQLSSPTTITEHLN
jgi:hypothetical protein